MLIRNPAQPDMDDADPALSSYHSTREVALIEIGFDQKSAEARPYTASQLTRRVMKGVA